MSNEAAIVLATLMRHQKHVEANLGQLSAELERRAHMHDQSKLSTTEFPGFIEINRIAREHSIGTPEYEAAMRTATCIKEHFANNSHHPEHHETTADMGWLDIVEMVLDWKAACDTYGTNTLRDSLDYQRKRHGFTDNQWWLILQVVEWIDPSY